MKKLFTKFFAVMAMAIGTAVSVFGQNGFSYQAVIRDAEGVLVTNKQVEVRFSLKHDGTVYYSEKQEVRTNEYGNIQVVVGGGERLDKRRRRKREVGALLPEGGADDEPGYA